MKPYEKYEQPALVVCLYLLAGLAVLIALFSIWNNSRASEQE
jgi:hypothetical protein